jgi:thiol-disulfide isomerase/thioredoxin
MKTNLRTLLVAIVAASIVSLAVAKAPAIAALKGKPMPKFKMTDLNGKVHTNASLKGKVVLLDFWGTWCGPCKMASPTMQALHKKYASKGLVVIGASVFEQGNAKQEVMAYRKEHGYTYAMTINNDAFAAKLGIAGVPLFVVMDRTGKVSQVVQGFDPKATPAQIEANIKKLLG